MTQRSMTPHRLCYSVVANLTLLGLVVSTFCCLVGRTYANSPSPDGQVRLQPLIQFASNTPISDNSGSGNGTRHFSCQSPNAKAICYGPSQIRKAYNIQPLLDDGVTGKGATIVIVDAFQAPDIQNDLKSFDQAFGLNDTDLNIIAPDGLTPFDPQNADQVGWSAEISLDVEWAHAVAPDATIDLVLSKSDEERDLVSAINHAIDEDLGDVITMSFGINETCMAGQQLWHQAFREATSKGITLLASSGDTGAAETSCDGTKPVKAVLYPAVDPFVTAVGGTQLHADLSTGEYHDEVAWNEPTYQAGTGGGFSTSFPKPFYQNSVNGIGKYRGIPDVSYDAAIGDGGVIVRWSEAPKGAGFYVVGGTSSGSPQWAGIVALAAQDGKSRIGLLNTTIYSSDQKPHYSSNFYDVTSGNNSITLPDANNKPVTIEGYSAEPGWDPTTGWGSPQAAALVPYLANHNAINLSSSDLASL
jgi:subtilase family serine protease